MKTIKIACTGAGVLSLDELVEFQGELKSLSKENYKRLKTEITDTGFAFPFHVWRDEGQYFLIGGHQRKRTLSAMREEGYLIPALPVVYIEAGSYEQAKRRVLQDVSQYGKVERQGLYEFMADASLAIDDLATSFDIPAFSMDMDSFKTEFFEDNTVEPQCDEDEVPEKVEPKTRLGDVYQLGNHRLMCGDSTSIDAVEKLINGDKADLWLSDPPYGVDIKNTAIERYEKTGRGGTQANHKEIANDIATKEGWGEFLRQAFLSAFIACSDKASHYVFTPQGSDKMMMMMMMQESGWNFRHELIWRKNRFILGRSDYHYQHEPILYGWKTDGTHEWNGGRDKASIIDTPVYKNDLHPTMKPIELLEQLISNSSKSHNKVLDLFGGSGSTLIACEKTNRKCFMMELDPHYCDVIVARWEKYTGKQADLLSAEVVAS